MVQEVQQQREQTDRQSTADHQSDCNQEAQDHLLIAAHQGASVRDERRRHGRRHFATHEELLATSNNRRYGNDRQAVA